MRTPRPQLLLARPWLTLRSRLVNLATGVAMVLGGITKFVISGEGPAMYVNSFCRPSSERGADVPAASRSSSASMLSSLVLVCAPALSPPPWLTASSSNRVVRFATPASATQPLACKRLIP